MVSALVIFCNTYCLMHRHNRLCVLAALPNGCTQMYPRRRVPPNDPKGAVCDDFVPFGHLLPGILADGLLDSAIIAGIEQSTPTDVDDLETTPSLSKALSKALCTTQRQVLSSPKLQPRILILQLSQDHVPCYNAIMNSIFSADTLNCPIDAVVLSAKHSHFLQQACYLTRGSYQHPLDQRDLLQVMLTHCLPSTHSRSILQGCVQRTVDFRAACVCHRIPVEFAHMCSVCLALFCEPGDMCTVCGTTARGGVTV